MEEPSIQAAPSTAAFYILITSHNKTGGNQVRAGGDEAINCDCGKRGKEKIEQGGEKREQDGQFSFHQHIQKER